MNRGEARGLVRRGTSGTIDDIHRAAPFRRTTRDDATRRFATSLMTGLSSPSLTTLAPPLPARARVALFLDIDGTLLDFASRPDAVVVDPTLPPLLHRLRADLDGALALLSGRPLEQVDALFGQDGAAAGLHGAHLRHADGRIERDAVDAARHAALVQAAQQRTRTWPGVFVEDKHDAIALHWRNAPAFAELVQHVATQLLLETGDGYELLPGHAVVEIKPRGANKGRALDALMHEPPFAERMPWMIGDDVTDEHAFAAAIAHGGAAIRVGAPRQTQARFALGTPRDVRDWLAAFAAQPDSAGDAR